MSESKLADISYIEASTFSSRISARIDKTLVKCDKVEKKARHVRNSSQSVNVKYLEFKNAL